MKRYTPFLLLAMLAMSCAIWQPYAAMYAQPTQAATPSPVTISSPPTPEKVTTSLPFCTVTAKALNLRSCGGTHCPVIGWLRAGDVLTVTQAGTWLSVRTADGLTAWVHSNYCTIGE